jgi:PII-like signaling protein
MRLYGEGKLIRIFLGEMDRKSNEQIYKTIVLKAKESRMAGATVSRGALGFGPDSTFSKSRSAKLSDDLPMIIEIVDTVENVNKFVPVVEQILDDAGCGGMITVENVEVIRYLRGKNP